MNAINRSVARAYIYILEFVGRQMCIPGLIMSTAAACCLELRLYGYSCIYKRTMSIQYLQLTACTYATAAPILHTYVLYAEQLMAIERTIVQLH